MKSGWTSKSTPPKSALPIETRVDVVLGDKVQVQEAGFKGRVDGHVLIEQAPKGPVLGTGQIMVRDGKYSLYGVDLDVHEGRILFAPSPVDNPGLDINVTRRTDDVLAGVRVLGTVKKPNATLYADRPMSQTDILAYLVTGKPFSLASQQEGSLLQGAALSLGGPTASGTQGSALFLGKYLTPRLYVQYGMGLFQNAYVFRVRYELSRHWKIQTETGEFSGGDILYQWEK